MAIRFVDKAPEDGGAKTRPARREPRPEQPLAAPASAAPDSVAAAEPELPSIPPPETAEGEACSLPYAKPEPKQRGRKKPPAAAGGAASKADDGEAGPKPAAPAAEDLLPGLQVHAKPQPKPRGRKKAFG